MRADDLGAPKI